MKTDRAIVVGVGNYFPRMKRLLGPENDARDFEEWLIDPRGGDVPRENIRRILSSDDAAAEPGQHPTAGHVMKALVELQTIAQANDDAQKGRRVGRRLYLYLAGHGYSPDAEQTALLMADATPERAGAMYHILGQYSASWFYSAGYFDEIVLFMDCCRTVAKLPSLNKSWDDEFDPTAGDRCRYFYAFGTKWGFESRERPIPPTNEVRGVFTAALLAGLRGAAVVPGDVNGLITAESLEEYLFNSTREFLSEADQKNPDAPKTPDVRFEPRNPKGSFVLARVPGERNIGQRVLDFVGLSSGSQKFPVTFIVDAQRQGRAAEVISGIDGVTVAASSNSVTAEWNVNLDRGTYIARVKSAGAPERIVEVTGLGEVQRVNL